MILGSEMILNMEYVLSYPHLVTTCLECGKEILLQALFHRPYRCCYSIYDLREYGLTLVDILEQEAFDDDLIEWWERAKCPKNLDCVECCDYCDTPKDLFLEEKIRDKITGEKVNG